RAGGEGASALRRKGYFGRVVEYVRGDSRRVPGGGARRGLRTLELCRDRFEHRASGSGVACADGEDRPADDGLERRGVEQAPFGVEDVLLRHHDEEREAFSSELLGKAQAKRELRRIYHLND